MNIPIAPHTPALADFVFRSADRMRIDGCANAIAREGLSLSLQCEHEALLDHYLSLLLQRLRQEAPEHSIEVYFPTNTDSLLGRFNEALARQSVDQATRADSQASPAQIWIVHDAQALPDAEIQLLARLIQNFPGANIRAILLMSGPNAAQNNLTAFGRKILRWDIEAPNPEQAQAALDAARTEGRLLPVQQLLKRINRQAWTEDATQNLDNTVAAVLLEAQQLAQAQTHKPSARDRLHGFHAQGVSALNQGQHKVGLWRTASIRPLLWVVLALGLSTILMLWLQPEAFGIGQPKPAPTLATEPPIEWSQPSVSEDPTETTETTETTENREPSQPAASTTEPDNAANANASETATATAAPTAAPQKPIASKKAVSANKPATTTKPAAPTKPATTTKPAAPTKPSTTR